MRDTLAMTERILAELEHSRDEREALSQMDEVAFRAFYNRTARPLRVYLARITGDGSLADDLLQEAYYRFVRAGAAHESESHRRNSLFQIATNLAHDSRRRGGRQQFVSLDSEESEQIAAEGSTAERAENRTDLLRALDKLKPSQRQMLWLAYALGFSHEEIAGVVGVSAGSVRPLLFRARKKLAELLGAEPERKRS